MKKQTNSIKRLIPPTLLTQMKRIKNRRFTAQWIFMHQLHLWFSTRQETFNKAYKSPVWGSEESLSGTGSTLEATENVRRELPSIIQNYNIKTMLDAPCGDWNWMSHTNISLEKYIGADIVPSVIENNIKKFAKPNVEFINCNIISDELASVDLIMCRDCLVHLSYQDIKSAIQNFKSTNSIYLFTNTYPKIEVNDNIFTGLNWRPLNMQCKPFNFPEPLLLFPDCTSLNDGSYLALWQLKDIP